MYYLKYRYIAEPELYTSAASKLTFLQALILELGICHDDEKVGLPNTVTSAKALLKKRAFVIVGDYLRVRSKGLDAVKEIMHPSRKSLARELNANKGKRNNKTWVKKSGLAVLLVTCYKNI